MKKLNIGKRIINVKRYIVDMSKYNLQKMVEGKKEYRKKKSYILMFHSVSDDKKQWDDEEFSISTQSIKKILLTLKENGYRFCTPEEFFRGKHRKKLILTFDDAYRNVYQELFPFLKEKKIPFIIFQTLDYLGKEKYMTTDMIQNMLQYNNFFLGAHTISHCNLHETYKYKEEIIKPIEEFKKQFNIEVELFAYPYGAYVTIDRKHIKCVKQYYRYAFCTCSTYSRVWATKFLIPRININENNYEKFLKQVIGKP